MSYLFACFLFYSFFGFLLEVIYSRLTHAKKLDRKCFLLSPLCPVYGFGAVALLALPSWIIQHPPLFFFVGGLIATLVEYFMALFYERGVGVQFWAYDSHPGNIAGRVCPLFSLFWCILACLLVYVFHPIVQNYLSHVSPIILQVAYLFFAADAIISLVLLHRTNSTDVLKWYTMKSKSMA